MESESKTFGKMPADTDADTSRAKTVAEAAGKIALTEVEIELAVGSEKKTLQERSKLQDKENIILNAALQKENLILQHRLEMERLRLAQQFAAKHLRLHVEEAMALLEYFSSSPKVELGDLPLLLTEPAAGLGDRIVRLHTELSRMPSLAPAPNVDALFQELVRTCINADERIARTVLADIRVRSLLPDLLRICSEGESLMEQAWAQRLLTASDPWAELSQFPYLENYRQLTRLELHALKGAGHGGNCTGQVCFLGGGPLPLSALLMQRELGAGFNVDIVDNNARALDLAERVVERLVPGLGGIRVLSGDASSADDMCRVLAGCDVVVVAALVGRDPEEKRAVLRAVGRALDVGAYLVVRTAHNLRSLLYPVVDIADITEEAGCVPHVLVHPLGDVVNSVVVARRC